MPRHASSSDLVASRVDELCAGFAEYVDAFDQRPAFTRVGQLEHHVATIRRRTELGSVSAAIRDQHFVESLWQTLGAWGMNKRAATLAPLEQFGRELRWVSPLLEKLECWTIDEPLLRADRVAADLWEAICSLEITESANRIVSGTKTLHHLLPDLIPPMDRQFTRVFFHWHQPQFQCQPERVFADMYVRFAKIAREVSPAGFVGDGWRTSRTKVLDNAIVAYCTLHDLALS